MRNNKGQFTQGNKGKPQGAKHKATMEIREKFQMLLENNFDQLQKDLNKVEPSQRVKLILELAQYCLPKLKATEMSIEGTTETEFKPIIVNFQDE